MKRTFTMNGSTNLSDESENELIKLAGFLESEELQAVGYYLKGLQSDVNDDVVRRIVDFSRNYSGKQHKEKKAAF